MNKRIGIVGGGQLGKMMLLEAKRLGFYAVVLDPAADCPCSSICDELIVASLSETQGYLELASKVDVITYEFEHISADALAKVEEGQGNTGSPCAAQGKGQSSACPEFKGMVVYPSVAALKNIQNKYTQKSILQERGIPVPRLSEKFNPDFGFPQMFKSKFGGYDGKGNRVIKSEADIPCAKQAGSACRAEGKGCNPLCPEFKAIDGFFEEWVDYALEVSVVACRGIDGEVVIYPVGENIHTNSILDTTIVPARITDEAKDKAMQVAKQVLEVFEGVGTFCVELFVCKDGEVLVNEVAPRPHNSGHYTIEGCFASQYENHIRAITGLPLGDVSLIAPAVMVNLLGESDGAAELIGVAAAYREYSKVNVHLYGKPQSKIGRKMGHYTVVADTQEEAIATAEKLKPVIKVTGI
ncbi:MAG: 5-(carboxyamino)imidazole ribonucleotide synthase [Oscillospiraceae bacterium]|nr:5-(carboxyamino)imidazole ribonucleotide synthase [Oscillospiraceae bacterium]